MALATVTNAQVDTGAAAIVAPYGPLARVSDVESFPTPNSNLAIEFTSALSVTVYLTYEQLIDLTRVYFRLEDQHSIKNVNGQMREVYGILRAVTEYAASFAGPAYSDSEWQFIIDGLRIIRPMVAQQTNWDETPEAETALVAGFNTGAVGLVETVTDTSAGNILMWAWDWGDGTYSVGEVPGAHTYAAADTYTITQYVVGRAGVDQISHDVTVA
jgi:PKD repeat protein